jgi:hypothetical protein
MNALSLSLILALVQSPQQTFFDELRTAVGSGSTPRVESLFARREDAQYVTQMASRRGGLRRLEVKMIAVPPGWEETGTHWVVIHTRHDIQEDRDAVHPVIRTGDGLRLGREVPEWQPGPLRLRHATIQAQLLPDQSRIIVDAGLSLQAIEGPAQASIFRLNDPYQLHRAWIDDEPRQVVVATPGAIPAPANGDVVRAGGLLIPWQNKPYSQMRVAYEGVLKSASEDKIDERVAYVTAKWVPSLARLPFTTDVAITGPADWILRSEGIPVDASPQRPPAGQQTARFRCDLPISFPKIVGGRYTLAAELQDGGRTFRSFQLKPVDLARGKKDVEIMAESVRFFESILRPFPFPFYECFDADTYYGIESYSYTLLRRDITTRFVSHEIGHTYFGGMVPSAYTRDTWNEGVTQYVDSVLFLKNQDNTLQQGLRSLNVAVPLTQMDIAHGFANATYMRGAYVMRMLEHEIGRESVLAGLRALIDDRRGRETLWPDLRPYFEGAADQDLRWFWAQWIESATFPTVEVVEARKVRREGQFRTHVTVRQRGTPEPYRLRFIVQVRRGMDVEERIVTMRAPSEVFSFDTTFEPNQANVEVFDFSLARTGQAVVVTD